MIVGFIIDLSGWYKPAATNIVRIDILVAVAVEKKLIPSFGCTLDQNVLLFLSKDLPNPCSKRHSHTSYLISILIM